jgi:hypothetical protein
MQEPASWTLRIEGRLVDEVFSEQIVLIQIRRLFLPQKDMLLSHQQVLSRYCKLKCHSYAQEEVFGLFQKDIYSTG